MPELEVDDNDGDAYATVCVLEGVDPVVLVDDNESEEVVAEVPEDVVRMPPVPTNYEHTLLESTRILCLPPGVCK